MSTHTLIAVAWCEWQLVFGVLVGYFIPRLWP